MAFSILRHAGISFARAPSAPLTVSARTFATSHTAFKVAADKPATKRPAPRKPADKAAAKQAQLPKPPKRPPSPFIFFFKEYFPKNRDKFVDPATGKVKVQEATRAAGTAWAALSLLETDKYTEAAKAARAEWVPKYAAFCESLDPATRRAIEKKMGHKLITVGGRLNSAKAASEALANKPGFPGKATSAFFMFIEEVKEDVDKSLSEKGFTPHQLALERSREAGRRWRALSEDERQVYREKSKESRDRLKAWKATQQE